jgi:hypothetical protein
LSRLRLVSLLVILVAFATALVACGDDGGSGGSGDGGDPQAVIDDASLKGIESGVLDLSLSVNAEGRKGGDVDISLSGPFQAAMKGDDQPQFDLTADASGTMAGEEIDFEGGLVLLPNSAYVNYEGTDYEVDPTTFSFVKSALEQAQQEGGAEGESTTACQEAAAQLEVGDFVDNLSDDGSADVEGASTTKLSGDLDVSGAIDSLVELAEDPACSAQVGAAGSLPSQAEIDEAKNQVAEAVQTAQVDVYVGEDDIVRQISARLEIDPKGDSGNGPQSVRIEFELKLSEVNEEQEISAPQGAKPLGDLFLKLGVNPIELLELFEGGGGAAGLGSLLEGFSGGAGGGGDGAGGGGDRQAYLDCLGEARTPVDLQQCAKLAG